MLFLNYSDECWFYAKVKDVCLVLLAILKRIFSITLHCSPEHVKWVRKPSTFHVKSHFSLVLCILPVGCLVIL